MASSGAHWRALADLVASERKVYLRLGAVLAVASALLLIGPLLVRVVVDRAATGEATTSDILTPAIGFLVIAVLAQIANVFVTWVATTTAWNTANRLRLELADHVLSLDLEFHRNHPPGELIQRIDGDITSVSDFLSKVAARVLGVAFLLSGMFAVLTWIQWQIGLGFLVYVLVAGYLSTRTRDRAVGETVEEMQVHAKMYGGIEERLAAGEDLRANRAEPHVMWRFIEESVDALHATVRSEKAFIAFWARVQLALIIGIALALAASAIFLSSGLISVGTTLLLVQYALLLRKPLEDVVDNFDVIQKASGSMIRVAELRAEQPKVDEGGTTSPDPGALSLTFTNTSFHYGDGDPILSDIDLEIKAGRSVGLVGRTGGGKTTLTRLLLRLVDATDGQLLLGGVPIAEIPMTELRQRVAMIPQEVHLLAASVRDNVTLYDTAVSDDRVIEALRRVGLDRLADGSLDALMGTDDLSLSAGEEQLVSMARIWLRSPDLVVLDEATARIDPATEVKLERAVAQLIEGRTAVIVAHRLSTLSAVDEIVVIDDGRIIEHGERAVLEQRSDGAYRRLLEMALEAS